MAGGGTGATRSFVFEQRLGMLVGIAIVVFTMALIWRNAEFSSANLAASARILLALGVGAVGATIPGFLKLNYNLGGLAVRASGGVALFLLTFFFSPKIEALHLTPANMSLSRLEKVEFRAINAPDRLETLDLAAPTSVTVALAAINDSDQLAKPAVIVRTWLEIEDAAGVREPYRWQYFVKHITGMPGFGSPEAVYLGADADVAPITVPSGTTTSVSIMHVADTSPGKAGWTWGDTVDRALGGRIKTVRVFAETKAQGTFSAACVLLGGETAELISSYVREHAYVPRYFQVRCKEPAVWTAKPA